MFKDLTSKDYRPFIWMRESLGPLSVFVLIWSVVALIHQLTFHKWMWFGQNYLLEWVLVILAIGVLCYLKSLVLLVLMTFFSVKSTYLKLPYVANHFFFEWWVNLSFMLCLLLTIYRAWTYILLGYFFQQCFFPELLFLCLLRSLIDLQPIAKLTFLGITRKSIEIRINRSAISQPIQKEGLAG